jgi:hypothetical protein
MWVAHVAAGLLLTACAGHPGPGARVAAQPISAHPISAHPISAHPLAGSWTLVAADRIDADGTRRPDYGPHPRGRMVVGADGRYATQIYSEERLRFAAGEKSRGTAAEFAGAVIGMSAHFGTIALDTLASTITFRIEKSAYPNWEGTEQRRPYQLRGEELSYRVPPTASGNGSTAISIWRRDRD